MRVGLPEAGYSGGRGPHTTARILSTPLLPEFLGNDPMPQAIGDHRLDAVKQSSSRLVLDTFLAGAPLPHGHQVKTRRAERRQPPGKGRRRWRFTRQLTLLGSPQWLFARFITSSVSGLRSNSPPIFMTSARPMEYARSTLAGAGDRAAKPNRLDMERRCHAAE